MLVHKFTLAEAPAATRVHDREQDISSCGAAVKLTPRGRERDLKALDQVSDVLDLGLEL